MQALTIFHKKRHRNVWLILGVLMLLLGVGAYFYDQSELGFNLGIGIVYLFTGLYYTFRPYVRIQDNNLWTSAYPFRKINLDEIERVKQFLDETIIISNGKETLITNQQMSKKDKEVFNSFVEQIKLQSRENVLA
jgi:hypothetical protein